MQATTDRSPSPPSAVDFQFDCSRLSAGPLAQQQPAEGQPAELYAKEILHYKLSWIHRDGGDSVDVVFLNLDKAFEEASDQTRGTSSDRQRPHLD